MANGNGRSGIGLLSLLGVHFVALRLCGVIGWPWWQVLLPFIVEACLYVVALALVVADELPHELRLARWRRDRERGRRR